MQERASPPQVISYEGLLVIVGGGTVDHDLLRDLYLTGAHLVGADGGADQIVAAGLKPEAIIGDFDSLSNVDEWLGRTRLLRIPEQETTDFEKALYSTSAPVTIAMGMTGKRFDHTLAALDAVTKHARDRVIILVDEADIAVALTGPFSFEVAPRERVSVHPLLPIRFKRSIGLRYPLDGLRLAPGERTGTSNEAVDGPFRIEPEGRTRPWLLLLDRKYLFGVAAAATAMAG
ncbi:MAG: thiamine diphosphokinase [Devosia sp.]|uniref:thiamine diphosphokinase n=1 Tax=Devosia sp. TaxID=1871048 RepID=UPI001A4DCCC7|nr:thiamine diphosphokinase [Devosia sp.]MBL8597257.1 thiamine diphosphokinase [Devosia sp.]